MTVSNMPLERTKKHQGVSLRICKKLKDEWPTYTRLPPIKQLANEFHTSQLKAQRAVQDLVSKGILVSKPKLGTIVNNNEDNVLAKIENILENPTFEPLKTSPHGKWVQIIQDNVISDFGNVFRSRAIDAFSQAIQNIGLRLTQEKVEPHHNLLTTYDKADALVLVNPDPKIHLTCQPNQILCIINSNPECDIVINERFDLVTIEEVQGGQLAGSYINQLGWNDVGFIGRSDDTNPTEYDKCSQTRLKSFEKGFGQSIQPEWQIHVPRCNPRNGAKAMGKWFELSPRPPVIFVASDDLAFGFINGAYSHGLEPGKDYHIIGFDGQQTGHLDDECTLTTIAVPMEKMGQLAAKLLLERLATPNALIQRVSMGCSLVKGNTVVSRTSLNA